MADNNEYKTVLKISAEGDPAGVDAFTESLKKLRGEASGSASDLSKAGSQAKEAASGMSEAASETKSLGDAHEKSGEKADSAYGKTRRGIESVSKGVHMLNRLVAGFGIVGMLNNAIGLLKSLKEWLDSSGAAAHKAAMEMDNLAKADTLRQANALADAQERAAAAVMRQAEGMRSIAVARASEADAGYGADLASLDADEQKALAESTAKDKNNEAGRAAISADFASRRRTLQRGREQASAKSAMDRAEENRQTAERMADTRSSDVGETAGKLAEIERKIAEETARGQAAFNPATAPTRNIYNAGPLGIRSEIDVNDQKRIAAEVESNLRGENGLVKTRDAERKRLADQKAASEDASRAVPAANAAAQKARIDYQSVVQNAPRRDAALDAMDALKVEDARRKQSEQFGKDQAAEKWKDVRDRDRRAADAALPGLYRQRGSLESEQISLETREQDKRDALARLRADEGTARWQAQLASKDPSLTPRQRRDQSEALNKKADAIAGEEKRTLAAIETIEASFRSVAERMERVAARIKSVEERSTAGDADIYAP
jgi:hypothetical protein